MRIPGTSIAGSTLDVMCDLWPVAEPHSHANIICDSHRCRWYILGYVTLNPCERHESKISFSWLNASPTFCCLKTALKCTNKAQTEIKRFACKFETRKIPLHILNKTSDTPVDTHTRLPRSVLGFVIRISSHQINNVIIELRKIHQATIFHFALRVSVRMIRNFNERKAFRYIRKWFGCFVSKQTLLGKD